MIRMFLFQKYVHSKLEVAEECKVDESPQELNFSQ